MAVRHLEGGRANSEALIRFLLQLRFLRGIDEFNADLPATGDGVFAQQVSQLGYEGCQQGVVAGAEIAADQQGLLQLLEYLVGGR